jgi:very-short-patch-repair endonuclease
VDSCDRLIARTAGGQRGVVTWRQLVGMEIRRSGIARRVQAGRLHRVFRGVYLVGHPVPAPLALELAALFAVGPGAVLSHLTAAWLHALLPRPDIVHVTHATRRCRRQPGLHPHFTKLEAAEITTKHGLRLTTPARTLHDLASFLAPATLERATNEAEVRNLVPRRPGATPTRSVAERRLLALLRRAGLPPTATNTRVASYEVDVLYGPQRLVVEFDSFAFHGTRQALERDRRKDLALRAAGYDVIRVTWAQLTEQPEAIAVAIATRLQARGSPVP